MIENKRTDSPIEWTGRSEGNLASRALNQDFSFQTLANSNNGFRDLSLDHSIGSGLTVTPSLPQKFCDIVKSKPDRQPGKGTKIRRPLKVIDMNIDQPKVPTKRKAQTRDDCEDLMTMDECQNKCSKWNGSEDNGVTDVMAEETNQNRFPIVQ